MLHKLLGYLIKHQVIFALVIIAFAWLLIQTREIILSIFLSYIIMSGILPAVGYLQKKKFPKILAVLIPYLSIILLIVLIILPLIPFAISQVDSLATGFPQILKRSAHSLGFSLDPKQLEGYFNGQLTSLGQNAIFVTTKVFGGIFSVITVVIVSFYLLMYHDTFKLFLSRLFKSEARPHVLATLNKVDEKLGAWLRGQVFLCFFIGTLTWIILTLVGLPFALPLAILAGFLEVVPTLGPIISAIPAVLVALTVSPTLALFVTGAYVLIQAIENHFLVPNVMQKAVGLNPVVVILSIMIGANLMGIAGALLAIPFISFLIVIFQSIE